MVNRRDFLKLAALAPLAYAAGARLGRKPALQAEGLNVIVLVMDAFSARHISWMGYPRPTMPRLEQLANRAIVYHRHFSGGTFTSPGTASLLTGVLPWRHRAMHFGEQVEPSWQHKTIFKTFEGYQRIAGTQNPLANNLLRQFRDDIENFVPTADLFGWHDPAITSLFGRDQFAAATVRNMLLLRQGNRGGSLFFSTLFDRLSESQQQRLVQTYSAEFPLGLPTTDQYNRFLLSQVFVSIYTLLRESRQPHFAYFHLYPPHDPYNPPRPHFERYAGDDYLPPQKPDHRLSANFPPETVLRRRRLYDEYLNYVDEEFEHFYNLLSSSGMLQNTIMVLTSDHGDMFERGFTGHFHRGINLPLVNVPLMIFMPGLHQRVDILSPTSAVDVLPTLAYLTGRPWPVWTEGQLLRPFDQDPVDLSRPIFTVESKEGPRIGRMASGSVAMIQWPYKLNAYFGYPQLKNQNSRLIELYDIEQDPEEMHDLVQVDPILARDLSAMLFNQLSLEDRLYAENA